MSFFRKNFFTVLLTALLLLACVPAFPAKAADFTSDDHFFKIGLNDDVLVMTANTSRYDEIWSKAGITDPKEKLNEIDQMGVIAYFYDPARGLGVNLISNRSTSTEDIFTFDGMSDEAILDFMNGIIGSQDPDTMKVELSVIRDLNSLPFIRIVLDATAAEQPCTEIIYGTIVNAEMLQFDAFLEGKGTVDESFLKNIVSDFGITHILTQEEYDEMMAAAKRSAIIELVAFILLIALVVFLFIFTSRRRTARSKKISDRMADFRTRLAAGQVSQADPKYTFSTTYDDALFGDYANFRAWIKPETSFVVLILAFAVMFFAMLSTGSTIYALITVVFIAVLLYMRYSSSEKAGEALKKHYNTKASPVGVFSFYDEYFKVSGLPATGEYIYSQVTAVRSWKGILYIFLGSDMCLPVRIDDLPCSQGELKALLDAGRKAKL